MADTMYAGVVRLHHDHCLTHEGKSLSVGLVRMANINPLVAVAKALLKLDAPEDTCIHYCVYHSRHPLAARSSIENNLDRILNRKDSEAIWKEPEIQRIIKNHPEIRHYIFVVIASPVAEVGRGHDYDWAIVEPSSMRSIIQLAGRVLRHRNTIPDKANILLLNKNYKALNKKQVCFMRPGFESSGLKLEPHDLSMLLSEEQYQEITAIQRIELPEAYKERAKNNLVCLEHTALLNKLFAGADSAKLWWKNHPHWCGEVQRQQRFRDSNRDAAYYLWLDNEGSKPYWKWKNEEVSPPEFGVPLVEINSVELAEPAKGNGFWFEQDVLTTYQTLANEFHLELKEVSRRFGEVRLIEYEKGNLGEYNYHSYLGVYQDIGSKS